MVVFAVTFTLGSVDWLMSLDPHWSSTVFAVYVFAGLLVSGLAALTLIAIALRALGPLSGVVRPAHLHDLGKLLLAFSTLLGLHLAVPVPADLVRQPARGSALLRAPHRRSAGCPSFC